MDLLPDFVCFLYTPQGLLKEDFHVTQLINVLWYFGIGLEEQAVEFPVLGLLALPSAVVLLRTDNVCPVFG